jgi:hypothetical protein
MPLGYEVTIFEKLARAGGLMWTNIPQFRLPPEVLSEEIDIILDMGVDLRLDTPIDSMKGLLEEGFDAVFIAMATCMQISDRLDAYRSSWHTGYGTDLPGNGRADTAGLGKVIRYLGP